MSQHLPSAPVVWCLILDIYAIFFKNIECEDYTRREFIFCKPSFLNHIMIIYGSNMFLHALTFARSQKGLSLLHERLKKIQSKCGRYSGHNIIHQFLRCLRELTP